MNITDKRNAVNHRILDGKTLPRILLTLPANQAIQNPRLEYYFATGTTYSQPVQDYLEAAGYGLEWS